jgi:hypothetical protein
MSDKLVAQNPEEVMVIRDIAPNVTTLSVPFLRFGRIKFGGRATIGISSFPPPLFIPIRSTNKQNSQAPLRLPSRLLPRRPHPFRPHQDLRPLPHLQCLLPHRARHGTPHLPLRLVVRLPLRTHNRT